MYLDPEFTRTHLFLITDVLGAIKNLDAKQTVEAIVDELFSDEVEEHPAEVENADLKEDLLEMSDKLAKVQAENNKFEKRFQDVQKRLEELKEMEAAWIASEERAASVSNELEAAKAKQRASEKKRKAIVSELETVEAEKAKLTEDLNTTSSWLEDVEKEKAKLEKEKAKLEEENAELKKDLETAAEEKREPDFVTFQGTTFTKHPNTYCAAGDDITQTFWHYWHAQGRDGKEEMRDAGWSVERVDGDWEVTISPEDFQAWVENEVTELSNLFNPSRNEESPTQPVRPVYERTTLPTGKEMEQPALELLADRREHRRVEIINHLTEYFSLTDNARSYLSKTGKTEKHMVKEGLIKQTRRSYYRITARGLQVLR